MGSLTALEVDGDSETSRSPQQLDAKMAVYSHLLQYKPLGWPVFCHSGHNEPPGGTPLQRGD